jgi:Domain of unknown function (DUF4129)
MSPAKLVLALILAVSPAVASLAEPPPPVQRVTAKEYDAHLQSLETVVAGCAKDTTRQACLPSRVGSDDDVLTGVGARRVTYAWVRNVLEIAASSKNAKGSQNSQTEVARLLEEAARRLQQEQRLGPEIRGQGNEFEIARDRSDAKRTLASILATSEFKHVVQPNLFARALNRLLQWLDRRLAGIAANPRRALWLTRLFLGTTVLGACTALIWWFVAQSRRQGLGLVPPSTGSQANFHSTRDWRRWLDEAQELSQAGRWREAVHGLYWAAISRLESRGICPADRTRTPREYLSIFRPRNEHVSELAALTRSFERIWYGRYPAGKQDYEQARVLFERLASR